MKTIELTSYENVAYWWLKKLKRATVAIQQKQEITEDEQEFLDIFSQYESGAWRSLYVELSYELQEFLMNKENDEIFQSTVKGCHNKMNRLVTKITGQEIPDISLDMAATAIIIKNGLVIETYDDDYRMLKTRHKENFVLTGDERYLASTLVSA